MKLKNKCYKFMFYMIYINSNNLRTTRTRNLLRSRCNLEYTLRPKNNIPINLHSLSSVAPT